MVRVTTQPVHGSPAVAAPAARREPVVAGGAAAPPDPRALVARVRRLRLALPLLIAVVVAAHQGWAAFVQAPEAPLHRFATGLLVYGLVGPLVTYRTLDWIARSAAAQAEAEERARQGERALASITSGSADAILGLDTEGIIRSWNRGATEILGFPADRVVGRPIDAVLPPRLQPHGALAHIRQRLETHGYVRGGQVRCRRMDGGAVPVDMTQTLLRDESGRVVGSSLILRDMSARVAAERAILARSRDLEDRVAERTRQLEASGEQLRRQNDQLEAANAELSRLDALKDEFVALVSHELRAPLANIQASVELLRMRVGRADAAAPRPPLDPADEAKLDLVAQEVERLGRLVRGVLDVSRMQAGRVELRTAPVPPGELCAAALARVDVGDHPVAVAVEAGVPPVRADFDRIVQVLVNLLENAAKYSAAGTAIDVGVRRGPTGEAGDGAGPAGGPDGAAGPDDVVFAVTDRGAGIPFDERERVFERFHRVERGDDRETYGHGLGLHIARGLVEAHGGRLWVASAVGEGSTFAFALPVAAADVDEDGAA